MPSIFWYISRLSVTSVLYYSSDKIKLQSRVIRWAQNKPSFKSKILCFLHNVPIFKWVLLTEQLTLDKGYIQNAKYLFQFVKVEIMQNMYAGRNFTLTDD